MLTVETLTEKKQALVQQREQVVANVHAIDGALQLLDELLIQAKAPAGPDTSSPPVTPADARD